MVINKIKIRGFRSFGNNEQIIELESDKGQLILMVGSNGCGKSSIIGSVDYVLYGKVRGKSKKSLALATLPNRINKELLCGINFKSDGTEYEIKRGINPNILELYENGILYDKAGKSNVDDKIQKIIGIDLETFKSFISMSVNDFKNFIALSTEEKKLLLDKLFNLESINILNNVLKTIASDNKKNIDILDREISSYESSIDSIKRNLEKAKESEFKNVEIDIEKIKLEITSKKEEWESLKEKKTKIEAKEKELNSKIDEIKREHNQAQNEINNSLKSIKLYDLGKCPTCESDLSGDTHLSIKQSYIDKRDKLEEVKLELEKSILEWNDKKKKLRSISDDTNSLFGELTSSLRSLKQNLDTLQEKTKSDLKSDSIQKFEDSISEILERKEKTEKTLDVNKNKMLYHKELSKVFSEDGVKKVIIRNIIDPINHFIEDNLREIGMNSYDVILDETFDAKVFSFGEEIDPETLSTGESRKVNISIMISYLKLIRLKKPLNVLFLDEVFSSIDVESIESIIGLLRNFANEYKINIFLVHHSMLNSENFDRILKIEKEVFSRIEEVNI